MTNTNYPICYAVKNKNIDIVAQSRSGGAFTAFSDDVLEKGGVIYGCVFEGLKVLHIRAVSKEGRDRMRNSKYIQSNIENIYLQVKKDLDAQKIVLFSGTPCQCHAIKKYIGNKVYENLILIDIVCQGVASTKVWEDYCAYVSKKVKEPIVSVSLRNKKFGWKSHIESFYGNKKEYHSGIMRDLISNRYILRPSCYSCPYKNMQRQGDLTLGDLWTDEQMKLPFNDYDGISLVLVNSDKGQEIFNASASKTESIRIDITRCKQRSLHTQVEPQKNREAFWKNYKKRSFSYIISHYTTETRTNRFKKFIKQVVRRG